MTQASEYDSETTQEPVLEVEMTYNALSTATSLSRELVAAGLSALRANDLVEVTDVGRRKRYRLSGYPGAWCKLPARALYGPQTVAGLRIHPFSLFLKRTVYELDALKLYLYLAAVRSNQEEYSQASFETICMKTGIAEKRIPRANAILLNARLFANINREASKEKRKNPNRYYILGYRDLFVGRQASASS
ncbi:hypothetical protein [Bordetella genomosp. 13]|uniref:hypothetical protein n=1 Tax=Bordetella genomosp. 13 TaxID=463040 RepID=UPI001C930973|nr:hypothetical protein [Bordetella genomosp. 13]